MCRDGSVELDTRVAPVIRVDSVWMFAVFHRWLIAKRQLVLAGYRVLPRTSRLHVVPTSAQSDGRQGVQVSNLHFGRRFGGRAGLLLASVLLASCGGGGGGDSGSGGGTPPPAAGDPRGLVALTVGNVGDAAGTAMYAAELALMAGQALIDETLALGAERTSSRAVNCGELIASRATARLIDTDGSGAPSAGDRIDIDYDSCHSARLDYVVRGRLSLHISTLQAGGRAGLSGVIDFGSAPGGLVLASRSFPDAEQLRLQGRLRLNYERSDFRTRLQASAEADRELRLVYPANPGYRLSAFGFDKTTLYDQAQSTLGLTGRLEGDTIGGAVLLSTPRPLINYIGNYPEPHSSQGRIEIEGAGSARARVMPDVSAPGSATGSYNVRVELDLRGNGGIDASGSTNWSNIAAGYLWWDELQALPYRTETLEAGAGPRLITAFTNADAWPREEVLRVQLSQPPGPGAQLVARLMDIGLRAPVGNDGTGVPVEVAVEQQLQGASLRVRPLQPLRPSHRYRLELSNDGNWSSVRQVWLPRSGMQPMAVNPSIPFATADTLRPVIGAPTGALIVRDGSARLTATDSRMGPGTRYRWSQASGPALVFDSPDGAETAVRLLDRSGGVGAAFVRLTVTNVAGDSESIEREVRTVGDAAATWLLHFSSPPGEYVGGGVTEYLGEQLGSFTFQPFHAGAIQILYWPHSFPNPPSAVWSLGFSNGSQTTLLTVGRYVMVPGAQGPQIGLSGNGRACGVGNGSGEFEVVELERDASDTPTRLAVDFTQSCGGGLALRGSIRFNSTRPLPN